MSDKLQRIYQAFPTRPLRADESNLYVDLTPARGDANVVDRLAKEVRLSDTDKFVCKVLAGHDGSGKSTELRRLQADLQSSKEDRFFVVYCEADEDIDRNDVDFPEILVAIIRQTAKQLKERENIALKPGYFRDLFDRVRILGTSEVNFEQIGVESGMFSLSAKIKSSPDARLELRRLLEPDTANWILAANDLLSEATLALSKNGYKGLVVIVDDLDKMVLRTHKEAGCSTQEYLFVHRAAQLQAFACHVIYTIPIELAYSHHEQAIATLYGGRMPVLPMTKITTKPPKPKPDDRGMDLFRQIIARRLVSADATERDLFESETVRDELIRLTGGQPTALMTLIREAIITEGLPINPNALERAENEGRRTYARQFRMDHWPIIDEVRERGTITRTIKNDAAVRELLESRAILLYINDDEWYDLNPLAGSVTPPALPKSGHKKTKTAKKAKK